MHFHIFLKPYSPEIYLFDFYLIGVHSMQDWKTTTRRAVTRKEEQNIQKICLKRTYS